MSAAELFNNAKIAGQLAANRFQLENPKHWYPCGFAWVNIRPARGPLVKFCKEHKIGSNGYFGGWEISSNKFLQGYMGQSMDVKLAAAERFAEVLRAEGISAYPNSRMD